MNPIAKVEIRPDYNDDPGDVSGAALAPADFNRRGVDDNVLNTLVRDDAVNPEAIAAGFVARQHRGVRGVVETELGLLDLAQDEPGAASRNSAESGAWPAPTVKASFQVP